MKKIVKLCLLALTSILVLSLMTVSCFAAQPPTVMPLWDNILDIDLIIGFDGNSGTATATLSSPVQQDLKELLHYTSKSVMTGYMLIRHIKAPHGDLQ